MRFVCEYQTLQIIQSSVRHVQACVIIIFSTRYCIANHKRCDKSPIVGICCDLITHGLLSRDLEKKCAYWYTTCLVPFCGIKKLRTFILRKIFLRFEISSAESQKYYPRRNNHLYGINFSLCSHRLTTS